MKKITFYITALIFVLQIDGITIAQSLNNDQVLLESPVFKENFQLFTDRNIYAANEKIFFRAFNLCDPLLKNVKWSKILYVEIINRENTPFAQGKYLLNERRAHGYIEIPETTPSGQYYIRAYTKWMRNFDPSNYFHNTITIINPNNIEFRNEDNLSDTRSNQLNYYTDIKRNTIRCNTDKKAFKKREKVTLNVSLNEQYQFSPDGYCLTVVKTGFIDTNRYRIKFSAGKTAEQPDLLHYYPETRGLSLSGKIITDAEKNPVEYARIHLAILGDKPDYFGSLISKAGRFRFPLPEYSGNQDIFIIVETNKDFASTIQIDNDFSTDFVQLPRQPFITSSEQAKLIREIMINAQVGKIFGESHLNPQPVEKEDTAFFNFFGKPFITIKTKDYIELPNLEEFFFELIPSVKLKGKKDNRYFTVVGEYGNLSVYKPLILLDHLPVIDVETILPLPPEKIDHIGILNTTYIRGYLHFGGIIDIITRDGNMAGIDIPENSRLFNYETLESQKKIKFPDYSTDVNNERIPDFRNCLFWVPDIEMDRKENAILNFYTSDKKGEYTVIVRGITEEGEIMEGQCNFVVK